MRGFEPPTCWLETSHSTVELHQHYFERVMGIEPMISTWKDDVCAATLHPHGFLSFQNVFINHKSFKSSFVEKLVAGG